MRSYDITFISKHVAKDSSNQYRTKVYGKLETNPYIAIYPVRSLSLHISCNDLRFTAWKLEFEEY